MSDPNLPQHFQNQHPGETVTALVRPHWLVFMAPVVETIILLCLLPIIAGLLAAMAPGGYGEAADGILRLAALLYLYAVAVFFFLSWAHYWFDVAIVTNERIVKINQVSMFRREIAEFRISRVQDVRVEIRGALATFMRFGTLTIQTAGEGPAFVFKGIPNPEQLKDLILYHQGEGPQP